VDFTKGIFSELRWVKCDAAPYFVESFKGTMRRTDALERLLLAPTHVLLPNHIIRYHCCMNHEELRSCRKDLVHQVLTIIDRIVVQIIDRIVVQIIDRIVV
jgi:hypothetical protein